VTPETVPYQQCREVRTVASQASNMDKITIAASAAICGTIIVAVIVFIAASRCVSIYSTYISFPTFPFPFHQRVITQQLSHGQSQLLCKVAG